MKKTFENKKNIIAIVCAIAIVLIAVVVVTFTVRQDNQDIQVPDTTQQTQYADVDVTEPTDEVEQSTEETSSEDVDEFEPELTEEASSNSKEEPTTTKKEPVTKKPTPVTKPAETPTKKPVETPTKKPSSPTFNGHKPYEVFADETGTEYYYTESGRLCCAETLTTKPAGNYDGSYCRSCGSEDCIRAMSSYYCVTCEKNVSASTCHPKAHFNASH